MPDYVSTAVIAARWGVKARQVALLCEKGRIPGAYKVGREWIIPAEAEKPVDSRIISGKYIGHSHHIKKSKNKDGERE